MSAKDHPRGLAAFAAGALLPAVFALPLLVAALGGWLLWRAAWHQASDEVGRIADAAADYAAALLTTNALFLDSLDERLGPIPSAQIAAEEAKMQETLRTAIAARPLLRRATILDSQGAPLASSANFPVSGQPAPPEHAPLAAFAQSAGPPHGLSPIHRPPESPDEPNFSIVRRRAGSDGLLAVSVGARDVGAGLARVAAGSRDVVTLLHRDDGSILARSTGLPDDQSRPGARSATARNLSNATALVQSSSDDEARLAAMRAVPGWPAVVVAARPRNLIVMPWLQTVLPLAGLGLLASIALTALTRLVSRAQGELTEANAGLERHVAQRTAELALRNQDLARNEERLRLATEAAKLGIWEVDLISGAVRRSPLTLEIFGYGSEAEIGAYPSWRDRIHPEDRDASMQVINSATAGEVEAYSVTYRFQRPDGRWIWVESHGQVVERDPRTGKPRRLTGTSQDISDRKEAEARQTLLAREVDHRAKNALAVVAAALRLTPRDDPDVFASVVEGRVSALARAHTLLAHDRWTGAELRRVIEGELSPFVSNEAEGPKATLDGPPVRLLAPAVQGFSMLLHELATNAAKHGALSARTGSLDIRWHILPHDGDGPRLHITWQERGGPPIAGKPEREGFGTSLIDATVLQNLGGEAAAHWLPEGLLWEATMPLREIAAIGAADHRSS